MSRPSRRALHRMVVVAAVSALAALASSATALAGTPTWGIVTAAGSSTAPSTSFTEGDGVQNLSSFSNTDTYTVIVTNNGTAASSGPVTVTLNFQGSGVSLRSVLPNVPTATGNVTSGSTCITSVNVTTGPFVTGQPVSGTGIPANTTLTGVNDGTCGANSLDISQNAASTGTSRTITQPATATTPTGSGWTCTNAAAPVCTRSDSVAAGSSYSPITFTVQVSPTAGVGTATGTAPMHVTASTTVSGGGAASPTTQTTVTPVVGVADLTVTNTPNGAFRQGDAHDSYKIVVINQGGGATNSGTGNPPPNPIVVTAAPPAGETPLSMSGSGWTCSLTATTAGSNGAQYTEPADSCYRTDSWGYAAQLPPITFAVSVAPNATTPEVQATTVSGGGELVAPITVNASTVIQQAADLDLAIAHSAGFNQGDGADSYSLTVSNVVGPNSVAGGPTMGQVLVTDTAPAGETITGMSGTGWSCSLAPVVIPVGTPNLVAPSDTCARTDALAVNGSYPTITVTVSVANGAQSPQVNTASVSGGGMTAASTANGGQTASDSTTVNPEPDLRVLASTSTNSPSGTFTQGDGAGQGDTLLVTIENEGFAATSGPVTVTDTVPGGLTPLGASGSGWTCTVTGQTVSCTRSDALSAGSANSPISIPVTVSADAPSSTTNDIAVAGGGEINPGNDAYHQPLGITQRPDLAPALSDSGFTRGDSGDTYSIAVFNQGLVPTTGTVTATATLGSGVTATAIAGPGWTCDLPSLTCTRGDSLGGNNAVYPTITITVNVSSTATGPIASSVTVSGGGEVNTANDTATDSTPVASPAVAPAAAPAATGAAAAASAPPGSAQALTLAQTGSSSSARPAASQGLTVRIARAGRGYLVTGKLKLPSHVNRSRGCRGTVTVQVSRGKHRLTRRSARLSRTCTYGVATSLPRGSARRGLLITARFLGNKLVAPTTAKRSS